MAGYQKVKPVKDPVLYEAFFESHPYCAACGVPLSKAASAPNCGGVGLSRHHMVKFRRSDEACNLLVLCNRDHNLSELHQIRCDDRKVILPTLPLSICLTIKRVRFPDEHNPERLAVLLGYSLPEEEPIPDFLEKSWCHYRGKKGLPK